MKIFHWVADRWFTLAENSILVVLATLSWLWFQPPLEEARTPAFGWIAEMYLRNLVLLGVVAGGLHLYFFTWRRQDQRLKFDKRELVARNRVFTLSIAHSQT